MYKTVTSTIVFFLLTGTASATFELKDPAAEIYENTPEKNAEYLGGKNCFDFLLGSTKDKKAYKADLDRVRDYVLDGGQGGRSIPDEARLREFCIDNPKTSLRDAVDRLVDERL